MFWPEPPMCVTKAPVESQTQQQPRRWEATVKQVQIQRPKPATAPAPLDLRTPSGRQLPF